MPTTASPEAPGFSHSARARIGSWMGRHIEQGKLPGAPGEYAWCGNASTAFWVDPREALTVIFLTQVRPSDSYPLRRELRALVYQAESNRYGN